MLAETSISHGSTAFHNQGTRNKRLADVKRGAEYYKKLDHIAEAQWKTNIPKLPAVSRRTSSLPKITTSVLSEPDFNIRRSTLLNMTSTPRQSLSMMSSNERRISTDDRMMSSSESTVTAATGYMPNSHGSLPQSLSRITHHRPFVLESPVEEEEDEQRVPSQNFNTWGTSHSSLDDKTKLTDEDMKPRELPFQYRDSRKLTVKPMPKKSMPMSRVAAIEKDRHQRTVTNFRSRNGTIRVIKPLDPLPEIEKYQKTYKPDVFDVENIEREKTFMMLERIDKILHPNKKSPRVVLGSSEEEILSTSRSSMTITEETKENVKDLPISVNVQQSSRKSAKSPPPLSSRIENSLKLKREKPKLDNGLPTQRNRSRFNEDPFKRAPKSFSDVLHSLDISQDDSDTKCQSWIDQCFLDTSHKNSV